MSFSDDSSDPEWKVTRTNKKPIEQNFSSSEIKPKHARKFSIKWLDMFHPWLVRWDNDHNKPFCRACQCSLVSNTCHIQRHARTPKHTRNLEILLIKGESAARENLSERIERSKYKQKLKKLNTTPDVKQDMDDSKYTENTEDKGEMNFHFVQLEAASDDPFADEGIIDEKINFETKPKFKEHNSMKNRVKRNIEPKNGRNNLLMQIKKDKNYIMGSLKKLIDDKISLTNSTAKERDHIDFFFESINCSVKALPLKLIAEAKMRVLQAICGLELRALQESNGVVNKTNAAPTLSPARERNHLDLFFESIISSVKTFKPELIIEAKTIVLQITSELEFRALAELDVVKN